MATETAFAWPAGKRAALSLSFDDTRASQLDVGLPLLERHGVRATFYASISSLEQRLDDWRRAVADGHEIGNHTLTHPCTGNFPWSRGNALEEYTLEKMRFELEEASRRLTELLGAAPRSFAYPCGQTCVGRGREAVSYVPLVAELFASGRCSQDDGANDPGFCDPARVIGVIMDVMDFDRLRPLLDEAQRTGRWVILVGHNVGPGGRQTTRTAMLEELLRYAREPEPGWWIAPVGAVAEHVIARHGG